MFSFAGIFRAALPTAPHPGSTWLWSCFPRVVGASLEHPPVGPGLPINLGVHSGLCVLVGQVALLLLGLWVSCTLWECLLPDVSSASVFPAWGLS